MRRLGKYKGKSIVEGNANKITTNQIHVDTFVGTKGWIDSNSPNCFVRIKNTEGLYLTATSYTETTLEELEESNTAQIWFFDNKENSRALINHSKGATLGCYDAGETLDVFNPQQGLKVKINSSAWNCPVKITWEVKGSTYYLGVKEGTPITSTEDACIWYFEEITQIPLKLNNTGSAYMCTCCFPIEGRIVGGTPYIGEYFNEDGNIELLEVPALPPNTPCLIESEDTNAYFEVLKTPVSQVPDNKFGGSYKAIDAYYYLDCLFLGKLNGEVGFYRIGGITAPKTVIKNNLCWLPGYYNPNP